MATSASTQDSSMGPWRTAALSALADMPVAVRTAEGDWSGEELLHRAAGAAKTLGSITAAGRPVPAILGSSATSIALTLGGALSAHPIAPLGARLAVAELSAQVRAIGATVLLSDQANAELARQVAEMVGVQVHVVRSFSSEDPDFAPTGPDSVVLVLHTSGTTGRAKQVMVRDSAVFHRAAAYAEVMGMGPGDLYCSTGGFHHTGGVGMLFVAVACGAGMVPFPRFSVDSWRQVAALKPTCALLVPTMIDLLLEHGALADVRLRALQYGTAPIHPETLTAALAAIPGTELTQAYGMTEGGPLAMLSHQDHLRALAGEPHLLSSVGRPLDSVELELLDRGPDGVGQLAVRAKQLFQPGPDGWLQTGDLGELDDEGFLYLRGRMGEMIIRGGENVYPLEVERALELHPGVREAAVIGVESRRWGQTIKAFVVPAAPEEVPSVSDLAAHAGGQLATFKIPVEWEIVESLPRNAAGKLMRGALG